MFIRTGQRLFRLDLIGVPLALPIYVSMACKDNGLSQEQVDMRRCGFCLNHNLSEHCCNVMTTLSFAAMQPPCLSMYISNGLFSPDFCMVWLKTGTKPFLFCRWAISPAAPDLRASKAAAMYMKLRSFQGNDVIIDVLKVFTACTHHQLTIVAQIRCCLDMTIGAQITCCIDFCTQAIVIQVSHCLDSMHIDCCCTSQVLYTQ